MMKGRKGLTFELAVRRIKTPFAKVAEDLNDLTAVYLKNADLKTILAMWPSMTEQLVLNELLEENAGLGISERFFVAIRAVPMVKEKLECLLFKLEFASRAHELKQMAQLVTRALNQLHSSNKFLRMMWALRDFGNFVNGQDAETMYSRSFSLESLLSLTTTKSFIEPTKTLFDSFVEFIEQDYGDTTDEDNYLLEFYEEINQVLLSSRVSVSAMKAEMKQLREGHRLATSLAEAALSTSASREAAESAARSRTAFARFADEVDSELGAGQELLDKMEISKQRFRCKYEENQDSPLEQNFSTIARFVSEFKARATTVQRPVSRM
ncbi:forminhomology 2 domaincontaining protein [Phytophthora cinnamomi]|uniref:forminhomology 2 domaincontaining protein n=1 Tax=Phytophthora cinnamomi TaxID=4785 RepID=UPI003559E2F7|nr:forminhomology 2 domaincontaining protein [Phytophthora cinnamomi]